MTEAYEPDLRKELHCVSPIEALFKLTNYINTEKLKITTGILDYWIIQGNLCIYEKLSKELKETGKIAPPY